MGRPRKSIADKARDGDTRKVGALRFAEELAGAFIARRGAPPEPDEFEPQKIARELRDNPEAVARHAAREARRARARKHWSYLLRVLDAEGKLAEADLGILAGLSWDYALMTEAAERGMIREHATLRASYDRSGNLVGLNERARLTIPKPDKPTLSNADLALAAGLPPDQQGAIQ